MSLRYLLDTNIVSEARRPRPNANVVARLLEYEAEVAIAAPTWHELWFGCYRLPVSAKRASLDFYLTTAVAGVFPILPYDDRAAEWQARERARLTGLGKTPSFVDAQIAAVAVTNDLTLVTLNTVDYRDFAGLTIVNWAG